MTLTPKEISKLYQTRTEVDAFIQPLDLNIFQKVLLAKDVYRLITPQELLKIFRPFDPDSKIFYDNLISWNDMQEIKKSPVSSSKLARVYNVSYKTIERIRRKELG